MRPNKNQKIKIFKLTSNWQPPNYEQKALQTFFKNVAKDLQTLYDSPVDNNRNLSHGEVTALRKLETRQEMVIKPADKGGKIVLWPTDKYMEEAEKQLQDKKYYEEQVKKQFDKIRNFSQADLLFPDNTKTKTQEKDLPFVIPYDNTTIQIGKILQTNWHIIEEDGTLNSIWTKKPFVALKKHKNLKDTLVKSKLNKK